MNDKLTVKTNGDLRRKNDLITLGGIFVVLCAAAVYLFRENVTNMITTVALLAAALGWTYYRSAKNGDITLSFEGDSLTILYSDGRKYSISDVERSFFTLTQTEKDRSRNTGTLSVASTNFRAMYVESFDSVRAYIDTHFEKVDKKGIYYFEDDEDEGE